MNQINYKRTAMVVRSFIKTKFMINIISKCTNRKITGTFENIENVIDFLRNPGQEHVKLVEAARKMDRKSDEYHNIKTNKLPAIVVNFNFRNEYVKGSNVNEPTGYLYLDVDGLTDEDFEINKTYVCAYWRSLSNTGMTILVKVDGLTPANLKIATREIAGILDIPYDDKAVSIDRLTVLSYDPNAYHNDNTEVIPIAELLPDDFVENLEKENEKKSHYNNIKYLNKRYDYNGTKLRFSDLDEVLSQYEIIYNEEGLFDFGQNSKIVYSQVFVPIKMIYCGNRENVMKSIAFKLVALNKNADRQLIYHHLQNINKKKFFPCLEKKEIDGILNRIYKNLADINPLPNTERRFVYDSAKQISSHDKRRMNIRKIKKEQVENTKSDLRLCILNWQLQEFGKLTITRLAAVCGKNRKTVARYYRELMDELLSCAQIK